MDASSFLLSPFVFGQAPAYGGVLPLFRVGLSISPSGNVLTDTLRELTPQKPVKLTGDDELHSLTQVLQTSMLNKQANSGLAGETAQLVKCLMHKPEDVSSIPSTHGRVERE